MEFDDDKITLIAEIDQHEAEVARRSPAPMSTWSRSRSLSASSLIRAAVAEGIGEGTDVEAVQAAIKRLFDRFTLHCLDILTPPTSFNADLWLVESVGLLQAEVSKSALRRYLPGMTPIVTTDRNRIP